MNGNVLTRKIHFWGSIAVAIPVLIIIVSGILLILRKDLDWIQPPTMRGEAKIPTISFEHILQSAQRAPNADIHGWSDISRIDVRPKKGIIKIQSKNSWEIQIDHNSGEILQIKYRRSGLIESIHEGVFFHDIARFWIFLPSAIVLLILWISGIYLFIITLQAKARKRKRLKSR